MPKLHTILMKKTKIIYQLESDFEDLHPYDTFKWKEQAFLKLWSESNFLNKAAITNFIAMGDSEYEMEAARQFALNSDRCLLKLVKLRDNSIV